MSCTQRTIEVRAVRIPAVRNKAIHLTTIEFDSYRSISELGDDHSAVYSHYPHVPITIDLDAKNQVFVHTVNVINHNLEEINGGHVLIGGHTIESMFFDGRCLPVPTGLGGDIFILRKCTDGRAASFCTTMLMDVPESFVRLQIPEVMLDILQIRRSRLDEEVVQELVKTRPKEEGDQSLHRTLDLTPQTGLAEGP